jgi:hypothetical protein
VNKFEIHPASLLAGAALAVLAFVSMAPAPVQQPSSPAPLGMVPARNMVQIKEGTPYTVPVGVYLVVTGVGSNSVGGCGITLFVNGGVECTCYPALPGCTNDSIEARSVVPIPTGFALPAGSVITLSGGGGRAWGYLERG